MTTTKKNAPRASKASKLHVSQSAIVTDFVLSMQALAKKLALPEALDAKLRRSLLPGLRYPDEVIDLAASAVDTYGHILRTKFDSKKARESIALYNSIEPAFTEGQDLLQRVGDFALAPRASFGKQAAIVYKLARALADTEEGKPLKKIVRAMEKAMKRKKKAVAGASRRGSKVAAPPSASKLPAVAMTTEKTTERVTESTGR